MSFTGELEFVYEDVFSLKKQRHRACDMCRRMKRRCDGKISCDHCVKYDVVCTYAEPAPRLRARAPQSNRDKKLLFDPKDQELVKNLKQRLKSAEAALRQIKNGDTGNKSVIDLAINRLTRPSHLHPGDTDFADITDSFRSLSLSAPADQGFQGKSSAAMLVKLAVSVKPCPSDLRKPSQTQSTAPRPWTLKPWESPSVMPQPPLVFPKDHLMASLASAYFSNVNLFLPLLQRPTFLASIQRQFHLRHSGFASVLLLVCTLGSLYLPDDVLTGDRHELARQWYDQVELCGQSLQQQPTLYDLQAYCLAAQYLYLTSNPRFCWSIVGFGLRLAEDIGAHRHKNWTTMLTAEEELEKRAMWMLLMFDTQLSCALGRPRTVNQRDMDIVFPEERDDDEYWEACDPERQPVGRPSKISYFVTALSLSRIVQFTMSTLYGTAMEQRAIGVFDHKPVTAELDAALNKWFTQIPEHLAWDPDDPDAPLPDHAASLACFYHFTRILIHRHKLSSVPIAPLDPPTRTICMRAARACIRIADAHRRARPEHPLMFSQGPMFTAGVMLTLNLVDNGEDAALDLALLQTAIDVLESQKQRWPSSGFFVTILERLLSTVTPPDAPPPADYAPVVAEEPAGSAGGAISQIPVPLVPSPSRTGQAPQSSDSRGPGIIPPTFVGDEEILPGRFHRFAYLSI
ncbi:fungal-specific transcription factor domain-containing protein [Mycena albidolilacea]|uniref:Fungal-specific transcription factor domain-containing protein n=1 Tax=Mycena albidolilacea TaxID=1033008 RepID=A0AAD7AH59_9AGAR|nr:fungal-specific transcription factor domain-containing protein [Mycena albidolilacea]